MGMDPPQPERGDHLNLATCVDSTFKVAPRIKRNHVCQPELLSTGLTLLEAAPAVKWMDPPIFTTC